MKRILALSGSRADYGLLEWPVKVLKESFEVMFERITPAGAGVAFQMSNALIKTYKPDCLLILGDRWEILQAAIAAHLQRIPIAHIGGGDVSLGSYDDAMRDCISRLSTWHFATSIEAGKRLHAMGYGKQSYIVGNPAVDYIRHGDWKRERPYAEPYVVVSYQAETIDGVNEFEKVLYEAPSKYKFIIMPNKDRGSGEIELQIILQCRNRPDCQIVAGMPHAEFLNLIYHCELFIGNSSSMFYECPELGVKTQLIGKRQQGRVVPTGDGMASERIREILCRSL